ncbi:adenylate cyclase [Morganella morganii]|nr:adenylate cyclase [Morganella morganii]
MAGKRLLWTMVPAEEEHHYDEYVLSLYAQGVLTRTSGWIWAVWANCPRKSTSGASLWQLYKSVGFPV